MRVVQINSHSGSGYFAHGGVEVMTFIVLQGDDGTREDVFVVKLAVNLEHILRYGAYTFRHVFAVGFGARDDELELVTFGKRSDFVFEAFEGSAQARDEQERMFSCCFFHQFRLSVFFDIQLVCHGNVLVFHSFICF